MAPNRERAVMNMIDWWVELGGGQVKIIWGNSGKKKIVKLYIILYESVCYIKISVTHFATVS